MKKSKVIVPALALIAFSTAASITGTVAWFTASRSAVINAGTYSINSTAKGLSYEVNGVVATTAIAVGGKEKQAIQLDANKHLTDGSFDHVAKLIYAPNSDGSALADTNGIAMASATNDNMLRATVSSDTYYTAAVFTLSVSLEFGQNGNNQALFVDKANSSFKVGSGNPQETGKAFRMAIVGTTTTYTDTKVLALGDLAENSKYISSTHTQSGTEGNGAAGSFAAGGDAYASNLIASDTTVTLPQDKAASLSVAQSNAGYLGYFAFAANQKVTINFTCVVWYDGTHADIVNDNITSGLEDVSVNLGLEARELNA